MIAHLWGTRRTQLRKRVPNALMRGYNDPSAKEEKEETDTGLCACSKYKEEAPNALEKVCKSCAARLGDTCFQGDGMAECVMCGLAFEDEGSGYFA